MYFIPFTMLLQKGSDGMICNFAAIHRKIFQSTEKKKHFVHICLQHVNCAFFIICNIQYIAQLK